ncbi:MAG: hypothetical protein EA353_08650 [Puniceicoccaceae bacterium]|nr:MAG: hypothetical protein EA353_08650 [Puniceicoccaceae bacterium]
MISLSSQRQTHFFKCISAVFSGFWLTCFFASPAFAQSGEELFRGTWQVQTPDQGTLIMILHNQGRAAYFWGDNADPTVYQGKWTSTPDAATLTWPDGSRHRIQSARVGFGATYLDASGIERYTSAAQQIPSDILGQWAKPPTRDREFASDRDQAEGFFGIWRIGQEGSSDVHYVFVESDRSAASTQGEGGGLRGAWARQGSELHIAWDSGHYSILRENRRDFAYKRIAPGQVIEDDTTEPSVAIRTSRDSVPAHWLAEYESQQERLSGGIAFSNQRNARSFYRGFWVVKLDASQFERIELKRFGGLSTSLDRSLSGEWRMQGQDIFMRWDDGMRKILSPIGRGFVLYEYRPGRPLDGVPTRTRPAAPADAGKMAEYMQGREDVIQQMRGLADAAGLDLRQQGNTGWGRTFARWVWPFGEDDAISSDAILQEEYQETRVGDPWWWPVWSENPPAPAPAAETDQLNQPDTLDGEAVDQDLSQQTREENSVKRPTQALEESSPSSTDATSAEDSSEATPEKAPKKPRATRDWAWPF